VFAGNAGNRVIVEEPEFLSLVHVAADRLAVKGLLEDHMPVVPGVGIAAGHLEEAVAAGDAEDGSDGDLTGLHMITGSEERFELDLTQAMAGPRSFLGGIPEKNSLVIGSMHTTSGHCTGSDMHEIAALMLSPRAQQVT